MYICVCVCVCVYVLTFKQIINVERSVKIKDSTNRNALKIIHKALTKQSETLHHFQTRQY